MLERIKRYLKEAIEFYVSLNSGNYYHNYSGVYK